MNIGLLWHDSGAGTIADKVRAAQACYEARFGQVPNVCYVNPEQLEGEDDRSVGDVVLKGSGSILEHHFWIGVEGGR
jgi:hypothetical protein